MSRERLVRLIMNEAYWHAAAAVFVMAYLFALVGAAGISRFSPDSWSYFELAKSITGDNFYTFNTYASYFSDDRSARFPFGFPALLAGLNAFAGWAPVNAAYLNAVLAVFAFLLVRSIAAAIGLPRVAGLALGCALVLWPGFLDEVASGRAYPAAMLLALAGLRVLLSARSTGTLIAGGALFGGSALFRFDFLVSAWIAMALVLWLARRRPADMVAANVGFVGALTPWIAYSLIFFHTVWASDQSWLALSANPAFVLDFPAHASATLYSDPTAWTHRVLANVGRLSGAIVRSLPAQPLLCGLLVCAVFTHSRERFHAAWGQMLICAIAVAMSLIPFVVTGNMDARYFTFAFFGAAILLLTLCKDDARSRALTFACLAATAYIVLVALGFLADAAREASAINAYLADEEKAIEALARCHARERDVTYIFEGDVRGTAFRYGALTGNRAAVSPSNFSALAPATRDAYFRRIGPYRLFHAWSFACGAKGAASPNGSTNEQ